jgi:hypothetical protein
MICYAINGLVDKAFRKRRGADLFPALVPDEFRYDEEIFYNGIAIFYPPTICYLLSQL